MLSCGLSTFSALVGLFLQQHLQLVIFVCNHHPPKNIIFVCKQQRRLITPPHPHPHPPYKHIHHPPKNIIFVCKQQRRLTTPPTPPPPHPPYKHIHHPPKNIIFVCNHHPPKNIILVKCVQRLRKHGVCPSQSGWGHTRKYCKIQYICSRKVRITHSRLWHVYQLHQQAIARKATSRNGDFLVFNYQGV